MTTRNDEGQFGTKYELTEYEELYDQYSTWVGINAEKETTETRLKAGVRAWLHWCEENGVDPVTAEENDVRAYIQYLQVEDAADTTITRRVASVSKYYHGLKHDVTAPWELERNPTADINLRKDYKIKNTADYVSVLHQEERKDIIALPPEQIEPLVEHVPGKRPATRTRNSLIVRLLWQTACRADELSRIKLSKLDWDNRTIEIRSSKLNEEDHPELIEREIWWEPNLDLLLRRWVDSHRERLNSEASDRYLFIGTNNTKKEDREDDHFQMAPGTISRIVKDAAHNAGLQEPLVADGDEVQQWLYTAHRLRHSRITYLANDANGGEGMDLNALRMMAGHAKFDTTLSYVQNDWNTARERYRNALKGHKTF
ncbi:integrase family protein [Natrialba magadii ATCC 43099]|uniref:Integrase n=1 Tax=Natrialba magadii (strain ATCC 43099 / DSM 3394 / CCM 3739 / CIP 104546 / IAM 13178 / JCM 8861 / NBRC 102185 / NCIMB 2190 / MS3) TaxID=547559 RepID=D3SX07_NATMM|nr:site-specific integrase [Natrialba magadii]ADD03827.1 integrase family protein [Natrialba magadii ATCC 43099]ELY33490.1 integrase [Natrialba magadii ATCC 43099]